MPQSPENLENSSTNKTISIRLQDNKCIKTSKKGYMIALHIKDNVILFRLRGKF